MSIGFIRWALQPHINQIRQELNRKLFRRASPFVEHQMAALLAGDSAAEAARTRQEIGGSQGPGYKTINEVRKDMNLPPVDGGNVLYTPAKPAAPTTRRKTMKQLVQLIRNNAAREPARIVAESDPNTLFLSDVIDPYWGVSASDFNKALAGLSGQKVTLRVNSPGGDVFDGRAMAAAIAQHGDVHAVIEGLAASAATYVTAACASVSMAQGGFYMIHNAWTMGYGNKADFLQTADLLGKIDETIITDYASKSGQSRADITK